MDSEHYRLKLLDLEREISGRLDAIEHDIRHEEISADWSDQATERENDEVLVSLGDSSEQELAMIRQALQRIDDNRYFHCSECGTEIPRARLDLLPYTAHCVDCAESFESRV